MILSLPVLMIFALAMLDFARGMTVRSESARAARHIAWATARGSAPSAATVESTHMTGAYAEFQSTSVARETYALPIPGLSALQSVFNTLTTALSAINVTFLYGVPDFVIGTAEMSKGQVSVTMPTRLRVFRDTPIEVHHFVALKPYTEEKPKEPMGWFDPYQWLIEKINDGIEAIGFGRPL